jgi:hypothetical protein
LRFTALVTENPAVFFFAIRFPTPVVSMDYVRDRKRLAFSLVFPETMEPQMVYSQAVPIVVWTITLHIPRTAATAVGGCGGSTQ